MRPKKRTDNIVVQKMNEEVLVYDLYSNKAVCLNETAAIVWKLCDGKKTASEIAENVGKRLKKPVTNELIWLAIDQLKAENLLSNGGALEAVFDGLTRREVVRKVGIASMIAVPIVSSIAAPNAVAAQSSTCFTTGTCVQAGNNLCPAGCIAMLSVAGHPTMDGSCGSTASPTTLTCAGAPVTSPSDISFL